MSDKVKADPEMAKKVDDCLLIVTGLLLEENGSMKMAGRETFNVKGYQVEISAKVVGIPFPAVATDATA